ncbi:MULTISPECIES: STY4528 family pathogenicity island replication protein [Enterobacterales]|uniref:STY4528 family pathogenicity island replication protein n=1 Tax=Enterobacterales TaxID=91347 RepID=UPI0011BD6D6E|nr:MULTISPECIES: STY4528 family pathogenicity island replication protein [Enterobacterales]QXX02480.1 helix-turn-helix domain-containing protein [Klebsiella variicola]
MTLPAESLIAYTLDKMNARLAANPRRDEGRIRNGLLFTGNVHDAIPRRLLLDTRLSPLDKMGWMMIRLYAQNNEGAVFPSYDELQLQLASPGKGKASRETVSRVLLMLRITGWLSLCKRVRDDKGRVRGNIYAQHDEPLSFSDAEALDPRFLDTVADACLSKNRTVSQTAREVLDDIKNDPTMRHYRSHLALIESRLGHPQTASQMAKRHSRIPHPSPGSESGLSQSRQKNAARKPGSETELSTELYGNSLSSESVLPVKSGGYDRVRKPNHYVRSITHSVNKNTYVPGKSVLPDSLKELIPAEDLAMLTAQLQALPEEQAELVLLSLQKVMSRQRLSNPVGWLLAVMKKAREGRLYAPRQADDLPEPAGQKSARRPEQQLWKPEPHTSARPVSEENIRNLVKDIRSKLKS